MPWITACKAYFSVHPGFKCSRNGIITRNIQLKAPVLLSSKPAVYHQGRNWPEARKQGGKSRILTLYGIGVFQSLLPMNATRMAHPVRRARPLLCRGSYPLLRILLLELLKVNSNDIRNTSRRTRARCGGSLMPLSPLVLRLLRGGIHRYARTPSQGRY